MPVGCCKGAAGGPPNQGVVGERVFRRLVLDVMDIVDVLKAVPGSEQFSWNVEKGVGSPIDLVRRRSGAIGRRADIVKPIPDKAIAESGVATSRTNINSTTSPSRDFIAIKTTITSAGVYRKR